VLALTSFPTGLRRGPTLLGGLEAALEAVKEDMRATSLAGPVRLIITDWNSPAACVRGVQRPLGWRAAARSARCNGGDPMWALVAVAEDLQDAVMETLWEV
jgi:hypothetical protein